MPFRNTVSFIPWKDDFLSFSAHLQESSAWWAHPGHWSETWTGYRDLHDGDGWATTSSAPQEHRFTLSPSVPIHSLKNETQFLRFFCCNMFLTPFPLFLSLSSFLSLLALQPVRPLTLALWQRTKHCSGALAKWKACVAYSLLRKGNILPSLLFSFFSLFFLHPSASIFKWPSNKITGDILNPKQTKWKEWKEGNKTNPDRAPTLHRWMS